MNDDRVSTDELTKSITEFASHIPPISKYDIELVNMNPGLSFISKLRIIRRMKRTIKENRDASYNT